MKLSDQFLAEFMLEAREKNYSYSFFLNRNIQKYVLVFMVYGLLCLTMLYFDLMVGLALLIGMLFGNLLGDYSWILAIQKTWEFNKKIIDWDKVETLSVEEDIEETDS